MRRILIIAALGIGACSKDVSAPQPAPACAPGGPSSLTLPVGGIAAARTSWQAARVRSLPPQDRRPGGGEHCDGHVPPLVADRLPGQLPRSATLRPSHAVIWGALLDTRSAGILVGMAQPVRVLQRGSDVNDIVNMAVIAAVDAQEHGRRRRA